MERNSIAKINQEICTLEKRLSDLKNQRTVLIKQWKRLVLSDDLAELYLIILKNPGIDRIGIQKITNLTTSSQNNKMTSLRRRGLIVNEGTRRNPEWYPSSERR